MTRERGAWTAEDLLFHKFGLAFPAAWVEAVCGIERPCVERLPLKLPLVKGASGDFGVIVRRPGPAHVLHLEYWSDRVDLPRTVLYHALYHHHTRLPVRTVMVTTSARASRAVPKEIRFRVAGHPPTRVPLGTVDLWDFAAEEVLERRRVALYPFVPLMRRRTGARVLLAMLLRRIMEDVRPRRAREEVRVAASIMALKRFSRRTVGRVFGGIEDMARTDIGRELIEMGERRGVAKGLTRGLTKGLAEGRLKAMREAVFAALEARFGRVSAEVRRRVRGIQDEDTLRTLHRAAVTAESLPRFQAALPRP